MEVLELRTTRSPAELLELSCGQDLDAASSTFVATAHTQASLLAALTTPSPRSRRRVEQPPPALATPRLTRRAPRLRLPFSRLLRRSPSLAAAYLALLEAGAAAPSAELCVLGGHLADFCASSPACKALRDACAGAALELYAKAVLGTPSPAAAAHLACVHLLSRASGDQFAAHLLPPLQRALKRNPDAAAEATALVLASLRLTLDPFVGDLLPPLLSLVRSTRETSRTAGTQALVALARRSRAGAIAAFEAVQALLDGSAEGRLKEPASRAGLLCALGALAGGGEGSGLARDEVAAFIAGYYKADVHEDVRLAALEALTRWLKDAPRLPAEVLVLADSGLKEKEPLRRAHLRLLAAAGQEEPFTPQILATLQLVARGALTKPALRWEGHCALLLLSRSSAVQPGGGGGAEADKLWPAVLGAAGVLLRATAVAKMSAQEASVGVELAESLLRHQLGRVKAAGALEATAQLLTLLQLSPHRAVAVAASRAAERALLCSDGDVCRALWKAMFGWLTLQEEQGGLYELEGGELVRGHRNTAARALRALACTCVAAEEAVPQLLQLACTQACQASGGSAQRTQRCSRLWAALSSTLEQREPGFVSGLLAQRPHALTLALLGEAGLQSAHPPTKAAAITALRVLSAEQPAFAFTHLLPAILALATRGEGVFSQVEVDTYYTPEGTLLEEANKQGVYVAQVSSSDSRRKARGRMAMYDEDDDEEAPVLAARAAPKPAPGRAAKEDPRELARQERLRSEAAVRARVALSKSCLEDALVGIRSLAEGNRAAARPYLAQLSAPVLPLLASPLVGSGAAYCTARSLAECCSWQSRLPLSAGTLAAALRLCALPGSGATPDSAPEVQRSVQHMAAVCRAGPVDAPTFTLCFPILRRILGASRATALHADCFSVLGAHADPAVAGLPFRATLECLYGMYAAGTIPAGVDPTALLRSCCAALSGEDQSDLRVAFDGLLSSSPEARLAVLTILPSHPSVTSGAAAASPPLAARLFVATHDPVEANAASASQLWSLSGAALADGYTGELLPFLALPSADVRRASARALAHAMSLHPTSVQPTLAKLFGFYSDSRQPEARGACVEVLLHAAPSLTARDLPLVLTFLLRVLSDEDESVRSSATTAGMAIVDAHGAANSGPLQQIFENFLGQPSDSSADEESRDRVRAGVVVMLGALGKHLPKEEPKLRLILGRLLDVLSTPSETVQRSVADCLPGLMGALSEEERQALVARLTRQLTTSPKYGERRGAAFGLAGAVKGMGISALKSFGIMDTLKACVEDKASASAREGALLGFECLCLKLGRLFEPYVIHILPMLLSCFGDSSAGVREATEGAANAIMGQLSGQGVKLVLPGLLKGLEDNQWRTKQGSVQLLGSMAFCAPKQLTACLPSIVPRLADTLTDTHPKVSAAARDALHVVGSVIRNPEIAALVPCILEAITDPNEKTNGCLDTLLETTFVNSIDAPSLALLVPVITRGLRERKTDLKKKARAPPARPALRQRSPCAPPLPRRPRLWATCAPWSSPRRTSRPTSPCCSPSSSARSWTPSRRCALLRPRRSPR